MPLMLHNLKVIMVGHCIRTAPGRESAGFTAVELLATLFVAMIFLLAGSQLYGVVSESVAYQQERSIALSVAKNYLESGQRLATSPCNQTELITTDAPTVTGLVNVDVTTSVKCVTTASPSLSQITVTVSYGNKGESVKDATYVTK